MAMVIREILHKLIMILYLYIFGDIFGPCYLLLPFPANRISFIIIHKLNINN